ncbi:hypothetical protein SAMN05192543_113124 [Paraburkholderia megapolitana]|uniref:Uncharacterized protein n=2 Tax=Paraburkholderia megapolitana TaxID=420953 RepID=A0A1I3VBK9_9BURK|nr:hypothetical protein SAMN05192543_113124 [Paraburkholderia megapolitana]
MSTQGEFSLLKTITLVIGLARLPKNILPSEKGG